jgi:regulatory protein
LSRHATLTLRQRAFSYLARRDYSRLELRGKLSPYWQETDESLDTLLDDLTERGYLSDARAATQFLHAKRSRLGTQRITHELRHKGIAEELIQEVLPELKATEFETAQAVWQRKFGTLPQDDKEKAKQMRFMLSRGFSFTTIFKILKSDDA